MKILVNRDRIEQIGAIIDTRQGRAETGRLTGEEVLEGIERIDNFISILGLNPAKLSDTGFHISGSQSGHCKTWVRVVMKNKQWYITCIGRGVIGTGRVRCSGWRHLTACFADVIKKPLYFERW